MTDPEITDMLNRVSACPRCRQQWVSTGALPAPAHGSHEQGRALAAVTVIALLLTGLGTVLLYRDLGSLLALAFNIGAAVMLTRDRARRRLGCHHEHRDWP